MKLILVDDDRLIVNSLKIILESGGHEVLACGYSGEDAIRLSQDFPAELLLLDIRMPEMNGLEAAREILQLDKDLKILLLTTFKDAAYISEALALGCKGYLLKQNFASINSALDAVAAGNLVFDEEVIATLAEEPVVENDPRLSPSQNEIVRLVAEGLSNREIAETVHLSEGTVRNKLSEILNILGLRDRTQLAIDFYRKLLR
ncbi:MAG: response regulator transcription factor [Eubacteriales bacterium]|nr:response regulator transcription factor [Eubacteriales bacterium]